MESKISKTSKNIITFIIYIFDKDTKTNIEKNTYIYKMSVKIIDIKKNILKNEYNDTFNYIDFENISEKIYKNYGKLFFDKGLLPSTIDNYKLSDMTDENRTYKFVIHPKNIITSTLTPINSLKTLDTKAYLSKDYSKDYSKDEYVFKENDFPPL